MKSLGITVGPVDFYLTSKFFPESFYNRLRPFVSKKKGFFSVPVEFKNSKVRTEGKVLVEGNRIFSLRREDFVSTVDLSLSIGKAVIAKNYYSFNSFLRVLSSIALIKKDAILLHASGLIYKGHAHVFVGKSGAGKSTILKNNPFLTDMGDEMIGIVKKGRRYYAFSTPFGGELGTPKRNVLKPLKSIYIIKKSKNNHMYRASPKESIPLLHRCAVNFSRDQHIVSFISTFLMDMVEHIPVFKLQLRIDSSFPKIYNNNSSST